jgi:hypothetical protein
LPTVKTTDTAMLCFCRGCDSASFLVLLSGMISPLFDRPCCPDLAVSISSMEVSRARTSAMQELEQAWRESDRDSFTNYSALLATASPDSSSWRTLQLSLVEDSIECSWSSMRWGMMRDGQLSQPRRWEPRTFESEYGYSVTIMPRDRGHVTGFVPTPTAKQFVHKKGGSAGRSGKERDSIHRLARKGLLPGHPKGLLNQEWTELAMGYPRGWTVIEDWAMQWFRSQRKKHSGGSVDCEQSPSQTVKEE